MTEHIYGPQDPKLEDPITAKCPECLDERLVRLAYVVGALVCPGCDLILVNSTKAQL